VTIIGLRQQTYAPVQEHNIVDVHTATFNHFVCPCLSQPSPIMLHWALVIHGGWGLVKLPEPLIFTAQVSVSP
jgi:hypothetical protein